MKIIVIHTLCIASLFLLSSCSLFEQQKESVISFGGSGSASSGSSIESVKIGSGR